MLQTGLAEFRKECENIIGSIIGSASCSHQLSEGNNAGEKLLT